MNERLRVGISDFRIARAPQRLITYGLGSCLGITLYDSQARIGGLAHTLLPTWRPGNSENRPTKFVDTAISLMAEELAAAGAARERLCAKIFGGANMFAPLHGGGNGESIGARNARTARETLARLEIPLLAEEVGGNHGRTVELDLASGQVQVRSVRGSVTLVIM